MSSIAHAHKSSGAFHVAAGPPWIASMCYYCTIVFFQAIIIIIASCGMLHHSPPSHSDHESIHKQYKTPAVPAVDHSAVRSVPVLLQ